MGCDIHGHAERRNAHGQWERIDGLAPFDWRGYGMFGFLAGVRNYSGIRPIAKPRGLPADASREVVEDYESWDGDAHSASWLSVEELLAFDYDAPCENRRVSRQVRPNLRDDGATCAPGAGRMTTFREFLGRGFIDELHRLRRAGAERVVFWFDN